MNVDLYVFGSLVRGEVSSTSDVDILAIPLSDFGILDLPPTWSVYTTSLIERYYSEGRLFAWHLYLESQCIYRHADVPFLNTLGKPADYGSGIQDIQELRRLLSESVAQLRCGSNSIVYELGIVYTALRDIAMSASWRLLPRPSFSREAPYEIPIPFPLSRKVYLQAMRARHSSTRGGRFLGNFRDVSTQIVEAPLDEWVGEVISRI